jgi:hypothetical protein
MSILDTALSFMPGGDNGDFWKDITKNAIPALFTSLMVKKPSSSALDSMQPYYRQLAGSAAKQDQFAQMQLDAYRNRYLPMADSIAAEANGIGSAEDLGKVAGRVSGEFAQQFGGALGQYDRNAMANGVDPSSGNYLEGRGALARNYVPGLLNTVNNATEQRAEVGRGARINAAKMFDSNPNFAAGGSMYGAAATGMANVARMENDFYRQEVKDTMDGFKLLDAEKRPATVINNYDDETIKRIAREIRR